MSSSSGSASSRNLLATGSSSEQTLSVCIWFRCAGDVPAADIVPLALLLRQSDTHVRPTSGSSEQQSAAAPSEAMLARRRKSLDRIQAASAPENGASGEQVVLDPAYATGIASCKCSLDDLPHN
jgi:hypothetical protein